MRYAFLLVACYIFYIPVSWVLVLRDGRAVYTILDFYPQLTGSFKSIEPYLVLYGINSIPTLIFLFLIILTFLFYILSLHTKISLKKVIIFAVLFQAIIFFSYPSLSTDIFSYIFSDRIATVYDQNVWTTKPITQSQDPFSRLSDWHNNTRVYGGTNQAIYTVPSIIGGNNLLLLVVLYKLVAWIFTLGSMWMVYEICKKYFRGKETRSLQLIFWNPLFLIEILGSGHNDILMIFFMLASFYLFLQRRVVFAAIAIALAVQIKIIAGVLFLFFLVSLYKQKKYKAVCLYILTFTGMNLFMFYFMRVDPISFGKAVIFNTGVYWQGFPAVLHRFYEGESIGVLLAFVLTLSYFFFLQYKKSIDPITLYSGFIVIYLLFFASAYWNWYIVWALCFVPFVQYPRLRVLIIVFSFTSLLLYPIYWLALRFEYQHSFWIIFTYVAMVGLPIVTYFLPSRFTDYLLTE